MNYNTNNRKSSIRFISWRFIFLLVVFFILLITVFARLIYLAVVDRSFLLNQGNARYLRIIDIPAYRGMILDRNGEPLAVSTPVDSIWINPQDFPDTVEDQRRLSQILVIPVKHIQELLRRYQDTQFMYLKRGVSPQVSRRVSELAIPGVYLMHSYRRYYPEGEAASQVVGFTNIDDQGQEGLELAYNSWLQGTPGKERVLKDRYGNIVAVLSQERAPQSGHDLTLSIDRRIQYLAYRVLKTTVEKYKAETGTAIVLNAKTGEILALVNQPSFNPNGAMVQEVGKYRNRAVTDVFEPGSTMKAFSIASAIDSKKYKPTTLVNTSPGWMIIGKNRVSDREDHDMNYGVITVTQILQKSSNVGVAKITLSLPAEHLVRLLRRVGFGVPTQSGFPGENGGIFATPDKWRPFVLATLAFGYGISVTPLQLTQAYGVIANDGLKCTPSFVLLNKPPVCKRVLDKTLAVTMRQMLESVVQGGTGAAAKVPGYSIAGKTGTAHLAAHHGYEGHHYVGSFVGMAPADHPELVVAVVIRDPRGKYYGAVVAAPAFAEIMSGALSILNIPPNEVISESQSDNSVTKQAHD